MGWNVYFFGFNRAPSLEALQQLPWLTGWRVFHEPATDAWFLEGPAKDESITFQEEVRTTKLALSEGQTASLERIEEAIMAHGGYKPQFDDYGAKIAMLLSGELAQPVASFAGDDEGTDSCFVFENGALTRGRMEIAWNKALAFDAHGNAELEWLYPEGVSEDDSAAATPRTFYQIGIEGADAFFDRHSLEETLTFDRDFKPGQFVLKARKGEPDPPIRRPVDELSDLLGPTPTSQQIIDAFEPVISAILDEGYPTAPNEQRFGLDAQIGAGLLYFSRFDDSAPENGAFIKRMQAFLADMKSYTMYMRPKPEFRKAANYSRGWDRQLDTKWQRVKRRATPKGRWFFR